MARQPEHPLHPTLCAWAEWVRAGAHNNEGWPGVSPTAPERFIAETDVVGTARRKYRPKEHKDDPCRIPVPVMTTPAQVRTSGSRLPRDNPPPPQSWQRITTILREHQRDPLTRAGAEAVARYYIQRDIGWTGECSRGVDLLLGALVAWRLIN